MCRFAIECRSVVSRSHIRWLTLHAFVRVLGRKQSRYPRVLQSLREELHGEAFTLMPRDLACVVDPERSPAFDQIPY